MSLELTAIEAQLITLNTLWETHTAQDENRFNDLSSQIGVLDTKIDAFLIREAERLGEAKGMRRSAIVIATCASILVSAAGVMVALNVG